jgi:NNP family nitrate/nitrite transporter-like MFS transporter
MREHVACLFEKDGWVFSLIYCVTFGGFIGLTSFLPSYYFEQFHVSKVQAGQLTMLAAFMGATLRVVGGWISDRWGGLNTLTLVLVVVSASAGDGGFRRPVAGADHAAADAVLRRAWGRQWRAVPAGAAALAGDHRRGRLHDRRDRRPWRRPGAQHHGRGQAVPGQLRLSASSSSRPWRWLVLAVMRYMQIRWTRTWAEKGGRARLQAAPVPTRRDSRRAA